MTKLGKKIMRRVYYAYAFRLIAEPLLTHGLILTASFLILTKVVSVPDVWRNLMQVPVGDAFGYLYSALMGTQFLTIILLTLIALTIVSLTMRVFRSNRFQVEIDREAEWV